MKEQDFQVAIDIVADFLNNADVSYDSKKFNREKFTEMFKTIERLKSEDVKR